MHVHNRLRLFCCFFAEKEYYDANNTHENNSAMFLKYRAKNEVRCKKRNTVQLFLNFLNFLNFLFFKFLNFLISKCDLHT